MKWWETELLVIRRCDPHMVYEELWNGFDRRPGRPAPFLWVLTEVGTVLMRSREMPRTVDITGDLLRLILAESKGIDLHDGDTWHFVMVCNPTKADSASRGKRNRGRRRSLIDPGDVKEWVARKGKAHGFESICLSVRNLGPVRWTSSSGYRAIHGHVEISGVLIITDADLFTSSMLDGIGSAKSAGMGMMILEEPDYGYAAISSDRKTDQRGVDASRIDRPRRIISLGGGSA